MRSAGGRVVMRVPGYMDNGAVSWGLALQKAIIFWVAAAARKPTDNIGMFFGFFAPVHSFKCCSNITNNEGFCKYGGKLKIPFVPNIGRTQFCVSYF